MLCKRLLLHTNCRRESMMRERRENRCDNKKEDMSLILPCIRAWSFSPHKNHVYYTEAGREVRQVQLNRRYPLRWFMGGQVRVTGETKRERWSDGLTLYPTFCHFPLPFPAFPMGSRPSSNSIPLLHLTGSSYYVTVACFSISAVSSVYQSNAAT